MLFFDVAQFDGILKKIAEFNSTLQSNPEQKCMSITEVELLRISAIVKILKDTSHYHSTIADVDIVLLQRMLKSWPVAMLFPVIDVLRMAVLHPDSATVLSNQTKDGQDILMETIKKVTQSPAIQGNLLASARALTNLFKQTCFFQWLQQHCSELVEVENLDADSKFRALCAIRSLFSNKYGSGTCIVIIRYLNGLIVCVDTRASWSFHGQLEWEDQVTKLFRINDTLVCAVSGRLNPANEAINFIYELPNLQSLTGHKCGERLQSWFQSQNQRWRQFLLVDGRFGIDICYVSGDVVEHYFYDSGKNRFCLMTFGSIQYHTNGSGWKDSKKYVAD